MIERVMGHKNVVFHHSFYHSWLDNSNFWPAIRPYRCQLSGLLQHVTLWVQVLLNRVSLMSSSLSHGAAGPGQIKGFSRKKVNPCVSEWAVIRQRQKSCGSE